MEIKELQDIIQQNGVVGAGGAGFPTYMKLTDSDPRSGRRLYA